MRPVFIAASPNTQFDDVLEAARQLITPWNWFKRRPVSQFEDQVSSYFDKAETVALDSARSAFYLLLKVYGIGPGDEVVLPAFTCLVIANPVIWLGATPVYVDTDDDFNLNLVDLKNKLSDKTRAVLIQHSFGKAIDVDLVRQMCGPQVKLIEDLAHALGGTYKNRKLGLFGDAAVMTFGIEKVISTVRGGMVLTKDKQIADLVRKEVENSPRFSIRRVLVSLINPVFWWMITPVYYWGIWKLTVGRFAAWFAHRLSIFGNMIESCEYKTEKPRWLPARLPGAMARLGIRQFAKLEQYNEHRRLIAAIYSKELNIDYSFDGVHTYLRFPVLVNDQKLAFAQAKKNHVVLGDWYKSILYAPRGTWLWFMYKEGTAPKAELYAKHIVNLPTGVNVKPQDAKRIAGLIRPNLWIS